MYAATVRAARIPDFAGRQLGQGRLSTLNGYGLNFAATLATHDISNIPAFFDNQVSPTILTCGDLVWDEEIPPFVVSHGSVMLEYHRRTAIFTRDGVVQMRKMMNAVILAFVVVGVCYGQSAR